MSCIPADTPIPSHRNSIGNRTVGIPYVDATEQGADVRPAHLVEFAPVLGPRKRISFQPLLHKVKSGLILVQDLDDLPHLPEENKVAAVKRSFRPLFLDECAESVDLLPHVHEPEFGENALVFPHDHPGTLQETKICTESTMCHHRGKLTLTIQWQSFT